MSTHELGQPEISDPVAFLEQADAEVEGRLPWSSNATFLVTLSHADVTHRAIYKPVRGERPLWDFEPGLHRRERAAYLMSELLELSVVPPTVIRDGPHGEGSFQWFVDADHREHYFTIHEATRDHDAQFQQIAALDILINNTDRKAGHCLLAHDRIWAIDNGLCFSAEYKLRTVIWDFAGSPIDDELLDRVAPLVTTVPDDLAVLLDEDEVEAIKRRATKLVTERVLPADESGHRYPWPLV